LFFNFVGGMYFQAKRVAPNRQTLFDARRGDPDVINFEQPELSPLPQNKGLFAELQLRPRGG
jgi:hypothetical protein